MQRPWLLVAWFGAFTLTLTLFPTGCRRPEATLPESAGREFAVTGTVRAPLADGQILVEHEDVPGFMPAMTMPFIVGNPREAARLARGDRVRFRFIVGETSRAVDFEIIGHENQSRSGAFPPRPARLKPGDPLPAVDLIDQAGRPVTASDFAGRATVLTFIFTRCPVPEFCPAMMQKFRFLQDDLLADSTLRAHSRLLAVTLDPEFDRPDVLRAYGEALGADFGLWRFATGETEAAGALARAFSIYSEKRSGTLDHTLCTALIGPDGRVVEVWRGNAWKPNEVLASARTVLAGASQ